MIRTLGGWGGISSRRTFKTSSRTAAVGDIFRHLRHRSVNFCRRSRCWIRRRKGSTIVGLTLRFQRQLLLSLFPWLLLLLLLLLAMMPMIHNQSR
jgi:uncharacterized membrane protein YbhN (UPF0104 family)